MKELTPPVEESTEGHLGEENHTYILREGKSYPTWIIERKKITCLIPFSTLQ